MVWNKSDLPGFQKQEGSALSLKTGEGLIRSDRNADRNGGGTAGNKGRNPALTRPRHREALGRGACYLCAMRLDRAGTISPNCWRKICAWPCAPSAASPGRVDVEELLDVVFRDFCIGK